MESLPSCDVAFFDNVAMHFYEQEAIVGNKEVEYEYCDVYDEANVTTYFKEEDAKEWTSKGSKTHMFNGIPLVRVDNNDEKKGDFENVIHLIDAYNVALSDYSSELASYRRSYMVFVGFKPSPADLKTLMDTGAIYIPSVGASASFLTKPLPTESTTMFLKTTQENIYKFSQTPNMGAESFAGNSSGVALDHIHRSFAFKCKSAERSYSVALRECMKLIAGYWAFKLKVVVDYLDYDFIFNYNIPSNRLEEAEIQLKLSGLVTDETRLSQLSFIQDPVKEAENLKKEKEIKAKEAEKLKLKLKMNPPTETATMSENSVEGTSVEDELSKDNVDKDPQRYKSTGTYVDTFKGTNPAYDRTGEN
jgi:SPP1 family phage portal protein